jgi:hypothetical protein
MAEEQTLPNEEDVKKQEATLEEKTSDVEIEIQDDTPEEDQNRKNLPKELVQKLESDELDDYDDKVKDKIYQLKKVWHDERREKERIQRENAEAIKAAQKLREENKGKAEQNKPVNQPIQQAKPDPKAEAWAEKNTWFGANEAMTYTALSIHKKLLQEEGFDGKSDEYYKELDKRIREEFPHKFEKKDEDKDKSNRVVQTVASANRSSNSGRRTVRLTPSQVAIAKKLGVPLEEYAKHVKEA